MKSFKSAFSVTGLVLAIGASMAAGDAMAAAQTRVFFANATSYCQTSLPTFDGNVRKRPLAVQNEGTTNAFVTCSFLMQTGGTTASTPTRVDVWAQNQTAAAQDLTCTMVTGFATGTNQFVTKTVTLAANGVQNVLSWVPANFTGGVFPDGDPLSISCNLLPGVGINDSYVTFPEDVGT